MKKTAILVIIMLLILCTFPTAALAADHIITVNGTYDLSTMSIVSGDTINIGNNLNVTLVGSTSTTYTNLRLLSGSGSEVTLQNVNIDNTSYSFDTLVFFGTENELILSGTNNLTGGTDSPGIRVLHSAELEIKGDGVLNAAGSGLMTAGIGNGADADSSGTVTISGGTVNATGGNSGAGIGGNVHITGGKVTATAGAGGEAIGDGNNIGATLTLDGCAELIMVSGGIESGMTVTLGDCIISGAGAGTLAGTYVDGVLFTGTLIDMSTGTVTGGGASFGGSVVIISDSSNDYLIMGSRTDGGVVVMTNTTAATDIVMFGTSIINNSPLSPFEIIINSNVRMNLTGANTLTSSINGFPGLDCPTDTSLALSGSGSIAVTGGGYSAGIGGGNFDGSGTITITGGTITATGGISGAGIGGGRYRGADITITGGTVTATGGTNGAGIGGGEGGIGGSITISGNANVTATGGTNGAGIGGGTRIDNDYNGSGGNITITGGAIDATGGGNGAGIGGGNGGSGGTIHISGNADVSATGSIFGAGIGGGANGSGGTTLIENGTVNAYSIVQGAGIGGGYRGSGGSITISDGTVTAGSGGMGAGIGGGYNGDGGTINISGGVVTATAGANAGAGIGGGVLGDGGTITISGGTVVATGIYHSAGIGGGYMGDAGTIEITGNATVTATGGTNSSGTVNLGGPGIGSGAENGGGSIVISGSANVTATGRDGGAGIGRSTGIGTFDVEISGNADVTATGSDGGAGIGGGHNSSGGTIAISGGTVYAKRGNTATYDIGDGINGSGTTLAISGSSAVFLATDSCISPVTTTTHTHLSYTTDTTEVYGLSVPSEWIPTFGAYLRVCTLSYSINNGLGTVPAPVTQLYNSTVSAASGSALSRMYYMFNGWNTKADGSGTAYAVSSPFTFAANTTLYAQWKAQPALTSSVADGKIFTAGRITLTPNISGGTWSYDNTFFSATFNSPATFTALKTGSSRVTYTVDGQSTYYDVTILAAALPETGQDFTWGWVLIAISALALVGAAALAKRRA